MTNIYRTLFSKLKISVVVALAACSVAQADDVTESDRMLCSLSQLMLCVEDGLCFPVSVLDVDIPQFLVIDLKKKTITPTEASSDDRVSEVTNIARDNGRTFLQGVENDGAYSILIEDDLGHFTGSIARDGITVSVFGACTDADIH